MSESPAKRCPNCSEPVTGELLGALCPRCLADMLGGGDDDIFGPDAAAPVRLGPYELLAPLGRGGAGTVWRARRELPTREVALKVLRGAFLPGENIVLRLRQEAETIAKLRHVGIVTLYEMGESDGCAWLAMELMEGGSLAERIQSARPTAQESAALVAKVAHAVHYGHENGVLHRDLKPHNILLTAPAAAGALGEPRVTDFGLAQLAGADHSLTVSGEIFGTPAYMAPEQAEGGAHHVDERSDVYALGAVLYELLEGHPPFTAESPVELLRRVVEQDPAVPSGPGVDRDLATICLHCLEKTPAARYASALALAEDLERWLRGEPILARRTGPLGRLWKWARRRPAVAVLSLALLATAATAGVIGLRLLRDPTGSGPPVIDAATRRARAPEYVQTAARLIDEADWFRAMSFLGEAVIAGTGDPVRDRVNRMRFESVPRFGPQLQHVLFPATGDGLRIQLSADGRMLLAYDRHQARLWDTFTGAAMGPAMVSSAEILGGEMNADCTRLALALANGRFSLWDTLTGRFIVSREGAVRYHPLPMAVPPSIFAGERFVAVAGKEIRVYRALDGEPAREPIQLEKPLVWATLSSEGKFIFALGEHSFAILDYETGTPTGQVHAFMGRDSQILEYRPAPNETLWLRTGGEAISHFDPPTSRIFSQSRSREPILAQGWSERNHGLHLMTVSDQGLSFQESTTVFRVGTLDLGAKGVAAGFSDSGEVAFGLAENGCARFWDVLNRQATGPRFWTAGPGLGGAISEDGDTVAIHSALPAIWIWRARKHDGASLTVNTAGPKTVTYSVDSKQLALEETTGQRRAWTLPAGQEIDLPGETAPLRDPRLSPDGQKRLFWLIRQGRVNELFLQDAKTLVNSHDSFLHAGAILDAVFSPDGKYLAISDERNAVQIREVATRRDHLAPFAHTDAVSAMAFSPDSTCLAIVYGPGSFRVWETATGLPVTPVLFHPGANQLSWSPDGQWLATYGRSTEVRGWNLAPGSRDAESIRDLSKLLNSHQFAPGSDSIFAPLTSGELKEAWQKTRGK